MLNIYFLIYLVAELITSNIKQKTEIGLQARDILLRGEAVSDDLIARMLDIKMRSPEVAHHGQYSNNYFVVYFDIFFV